MNAVDRLIAVAEAEIGYLEKKSNKYLDDKTANAGSGNYTRYNRDVKALTGACGLNDQWCQVFVCWCFIQAFGLEGAKRLIHTVTNYTPTGSNAFKARGAYIRRGQGAPRRGDVIYFYSAAKGRIGHVGIVWKVTADRVYTIEGNTSGANTLITNGGGVRKKSYGLSSAYIDGYGRVDYTALEGGDRSALAFGDIGEDVAAMQGLLLKWDAGCLPRYGADGEFGSETRGALRAFQRAQGLEATGAYDDAARQALLAATAETIEITGGSVNVRAAPGTDAAILGVAHRGERLVRRGMPSPEGWHPVIYRDQDAWVSGKYARLTGEEGGKTT